MARETHHGTDRSGWWAGALGIALLLILGLAPAATAAPARAATPARTIAVTGAVAIPATYTAADLAALPQSTGPVAGVDLLTLVTRAAPVLPPGRNTQLRFSVTATGRAHAVTFALGELDPLFGNHPAVLTRAGDRTRLVVPGDSNRLRTVFDVTGVRVAVSTAAVAPVEPGSVVVVGDRRTVTLSAATIARLPARTSTVSFLAGGVPQTRTEHGPPLALVLLAAGILPTPNMSVVAVGTDGYGAGVTLAEDYVGGRPLSLSTVEDGVPLARPRLIVDGDVRGGRYVSDVVVLEVTRRR